jgi:hypothetical protein
MPNYQSQYDRILEHLRTHNNRITALEAMNEYGIQRLAARISVLRSEGYVFDTETTAGTNRYGDRVHYTTYVLVSEP